MKKINTQQINDLLISNSNSEHSIKLLKDIIESIEAYPELYKVKKSDELVTSNKKDYEKELEKINQNYLEEKNKIDKSNLKVIKELLTEIETKLIDFYNDKDEDNIISRINYLNDNKLTEIFQKESKLKEKLKKQQINSLKLKLKTELYNIDKNLTFYAKISKNDSSFKVNETLNQETKLEELFKKMSIEKLIEDIDLEEYTKEFYKQLGSNLLDLDYNNLYINKKDSKLNRLRIMIYPNLKIITLLKNTKQNSKQLNEELKELQKQCIEIADLLIRREQFQNLKKFLEQNKFNLTVEYIQDQIKKLNQNINKKELKINQRTQELDIKNIHIIEKNNFLKELLKTTSEESKTKFNYNLSSPEYKKIIKEDIINYQNFILYERYNITIEELNDLILEEEKNIPKINQLQSQKVISKKKKKSIRDILKSKK